MYKTTDSVKECTDYNDEVSDAGKLDEILKIMLRNIECKVKLHV